MLTDRALERLRVLGLSGMADAFIELDNTPTPPSSRARTGSGCSSIAKQPAVRTNASPDACARPACGSGLPSKTSTCARPAGSTALCSSSFPPANGCAIITIWWW